jgi:hypothetical protein
MRARGYGSTNAHPTMLRTGTCVTAWRSARLTRLDLIEIRPVECRPMPDRPARAFLNAHLWSLRSEVESQIRNMTKAHRALDVLVPPDDARRGDEVAKLVAGLQQVLDANITIRALCENALREAKRLAPGAIAPTD